jgi:phosphate transport system substrate-binding protein
MAHPPIPLRSRSRTCVGRVVAGLLAGCLFACTPAQTGDAADSARAMTSSTRVDLTGAGATFPYPIYARWFNDYATQSGVRINYQSIGSGGGIRQVIARTVDFGATDVPMTDAELAAAKTRILHIPTVLGAVAITYNLPELGRPLRLSGDVLADIFHGRLRRWNDARIAELNPGAPLPDADILVVHRADGSGTSYIFSEYLAAVSPGWAAGPGRGKDVRWPTGIGGKGNEGVAGQVKQMPGSIGYVEVVYARQNHLPVAHLRNRAGRFVSPQPFEIAAAASGVTDTLPQTSDLRVSLVNGGGEHDYPISSFTWLLLAPDDIGPRRTGQVVAFLRWAFSRGADLAMELGYVPLPTAIAERVLDQIEPLASTATTQP